MLVVGETRLEGGAEAELAYPLRGGTRGPGVDLRGDLPEARCVEDGRRHAIAATSIAALCETDEGTLLMLPGGKLVHVHECMLLVLSWIGVR